MLTKSLEETPACTVTQQKQIHICMYVFNNFSLTCGRTQIMQPELAETQDNSARWTESVIYAGRITAEQ